AGPGGAVVIEPRVLDHTAEIDTKDIYGTRYLGLRLLAEAKGADGPAFQPVIDSKRLEETLKKRTELIVEPVGLDDTPPENVELDVNPDLKDGGLWRKNGRLQLARGRSLPVKTTATDEESAISRVVFFTGRPENKQVPKGAPQVEGEHVSGTSKD